MVEELDSEVVVDVDAGPEVLPVSVPLGRARPDVVGIDTNRVG